MSGRPAWTLDHAPVEPFLAPRLAFAPGIQPLDPADWLFTAADHPGQMALRDRLDAERRDEVTAVLPEGAEAAEELAEAVAAEVIARHGAVRVPGGVRRADGVVVPDDLPAINRLNRLAQEDFLIMQRPEGADEHVLTAGTLSFPSHWRLDEKIGRALIRIHMPVREYPGDLARRVQRFFDGVQPGRPLWRANWHFAVKPEIATPASEVRKVENYHHMIMHGAEAAWLRVERQTVLRLPRTRAAVFGVRTIMTPLDVLSADQWRAILARIAEAPPEARQRRGLPAALRRAREVTGDPGLGADDPRLEAAG